MYYSLPIMYFRQKEREVSVNINLLYYATD